MGEQVPTHLLEREFILLRINQRVTESQGAFRTTSCLAQVASGYRWSLLRSVGPAFGAETTGRKSMKHFRGGIAVIATTTTMVLSSMLIGLTSASAAEQCDFALLKPLPIVFESYTPGHQVVIPGVRISDPGRAAGCFVKICVQGSESIPLNCTVQQVQVGRQDYASLDKTLGYGIDCTSPGPRRGIEVRSYARWDNENLMKLGPPARTC
ncbi:MAG: hypothetical protein ACT4RN_07225 [Pseudonocardia sp.]